MSLKRFQREFTAARKAADRGETVVIMADNNSEYVFCRKPAAASRHFAYLDDVFGAVALETTDQSPRAKIRARLQRAADAV